MQKKLFLKNTLILTFTALLLRSIGIFFRIYLSNIIGAEGMGIYQLIFCVYTLMCVLVSGGFNISATKLVAAKPGCRKNIMNLCFKMCLLISLFFCILFFIFSDITAQKCIGYSYASKCIKILNAGLVFVSLSSCIKGYFTAVRKVSVCSNSQLFEQSIRMGLVFILLSKMRSGDIYGCCCAVVFANAASELAAFLFLYISYKKDVRSIKGAQPDKSVFKDFSHIFLPVTVSSYVNTALHTAENLIVPDAVFKHTLNRTLSVSLFGMIKGMAIPVIFFPASFLSAVSTLLLPEISQMNENNNTKSINKTLSITIHITIALSVGIAAVFFICAYDISDILYHDRTVGLFLRMLSPVIPFMYVESIIAGTLSALDLHIASMRFNIYNSIIRIAAILTFVPAFGINAFVYIMIASNVFTSSINFIWIKKRADFKINMSNFFIKPVFAAACACFCSSFAPAPDLPAFLYVAYRCALVFSFYILLLILFKTFDFNSISIIKKRFSAAR